MDSDRQYLDTLSEPCRRLKCNRSPGGGARARAARALLKSASNEMYRSIGGAAAREHSSGVNYRAISAHAPPTWALTTKSSAATFSNLVRGLLAEHPYYEVLIRTWYVAVPLMLMSTREWEDGASQTSPSDLRILKKAFAVNATINAWIRKTIDIVTRYDKLRYFKIVNRF